MGESSNSFILEMRNITKSFGGVQALRDVSFQCKPGTVHALVGENGAGKSQSTAGSASFTKNSPWFLK